MDGEKHMGARRVFVGVTAAVVIALLVAFLLRSGLLADGWEGVTATGRDIGERYGLDITATVIGFVIAEILYLGTIAMMLASAGRSHAWTDIRSFRIRDLRLDTPRMLMWWWLNRAVWAVFWGVVIVVTWGHVPWWATAAAAVDIAVNLFWGVVIAFGIRLPDRHRAARPG